MESGRDRLRGMEAEAGRLSGLLAQRSREVEQLTSLSLHGDATLQEYMTKIKVG